MDPSRFGLHRRPFRFVPDAALYYPATTHETALARVADALADGEGFALVAGPPGSGKTLLAHILIDRTGDDVASAVLTHSRYHRRSELFQAILFELGLPHESRHEQDLRLALTEYLLGRHAAGQSTVLFVDEAHGLPAELLEELRLLGNLESPAGKAVQIVLLGLPGLLDTLDRPELAALAQRTAARCRLEPLDVHESADYLLHHLRLAGARKAVFCDEALDALARGCKGLPRLLNQTAHAALNLADRDGNSQVDLEAALEALRQHQLDGTAADEPPPIPLAREDRPNAPRLLYAPGLPG